MASKSFGRWTGAYLAAMAIRTVSLLPSWERWKMPFAAKMAMAEEERSTKRNSRR